jgi:hypothetical protein
MPFSFQEQSQAAELLQMLPVIALTTSSCKGAILKGTAWSKSTDIIITVKKIQYEIIL